MCDESISLFGHTVAVHVVSAPTNQYVSINGTLLLSCNVTGSEPISYQWFKDGEQLQDGGRVSGSNSSRLEVKPVEGNDFGNYQCNASNDVNHALSAVAQVEGMSHVYFMHTLCHCSHQCDMHICYVYSPPTISISFPATPPPLPLTFFYPSPLSFFSLSTPRLLYMIVAPLIVNILVTPSIGVPRGAAINLTCQAVGGPIRNVTWTTPAGPRTGSVISVNSVTADDAGIYRCEVVSEAGTTSGSIFIIGEGIKQWRYTEGVEVYVYIVAKDSSEADPQI